MRTTLRAVVALLLASGAASHAGQDGVPAVQQQRSAAQPAHAGAQAVPQLRPARRLSPAEHRFLVEAAQSGHAEAQAGRLARARSASAEVRDYARQLVEDHEAANVQLRQIAQAHGITPPGAPSPQQRRWLGLLASLQGPAFDQRFLQQMMEDHRKAIDLFADVAGNELHDRALQGYARQTLPVLRDHLSRAQRLHAQSRVEAMQHSGPAPAAGRAGELSNARQQVRDAIQVVQRMKSDPRIAQLLQRAQGVFIVPDYARGGFGLGVQAGEGVLVTRDGQGFSGPAFYNMGGISVGPQAGLAGGEVAFLLMTERAVQQFRSERKFSLTIDAGLTITDASFRGHASTGKVQDVLVWSGTGGAYAGISVGVTDVFADHAENRAYYDRADASPLTILSGRLEDPYGNALGRVLGA